MKVVLLMIKILILLITNIKENLSFGVVKKMIK